MYGMMPSAKIVARENAPPTNTSYSPNSVPAWVGEHRRQGLCVHPRRRDVLPEPVDGEHPEREEQTLLQFRDAEHVLDRIDECHPSSPRPPRG